jgi:hypothetical protein
MNVADSKQAVANGWLMTAAGRRAARSAHRKPNAFRIHPPHYPSPGSARDFRW